MQRLEFIDRAARPIPLGMIFVVAFLIHAPLLLMKLPLKSYDTNFHIFFASHYSQHWFDPWNTKWYAGFSQTTYPPLPQQWTALFSRVIGLDYAYMLVQFVAILLLALGVYRFAKLWVSPRAAGFAAMASVLLGSEAFLIYSAGQLSTTFAAPLYLNALPYLYEWMRWRNWRALLKGAALSAAAAAAHHATLLFGSFLFAVPVLALAIMDVRESRRAHIGSFVMRTVFLAALVGAMIALVLLPFWIALINYSVWGNDSCLAIYFSARIIDSAPAAFTAGFLGRVPAGVGRHDACGKAPARTCFRSSHDGAVHLLGDSTRLAICGIAGRRTY